MKYCILDTFEKHQDSSGNYKTVIINYSLNRLNSEMEAENGRYYEPKHASLCIFLKGLLPFLGHVVLPEI